MPFLDDLIARLKLDTGQYDQAAKGAAQKPKLFENAWKNMASRFVITAGDVVNAIKSITSGMVGMIERGGAVGDVMAATAIDIQSAREATQGLVNDFDLASKANAAVAAGLNLTQHQFEAMAKAAIILGQKTGKDASQAFDQLLNSVVAAETRGLKQFGIAFDAVNTKLSAEEQLLARQTQAVDKLTVKYGEAAVVVDDAGESLTQASVAWRNMADAFGVAVAASEPIIGSLVAMRDVINAITSPRHMDDMSKIMFLFFGSAEQVAEMRDEELALARALEAGEAVQRDNALSLGVMAAQARGATAALDPFRFLLSEIGREAGKLGTFLPNMFPSVADQERAKGASDAAAAARKEQLDREREWAKEIPAIREALRAQEFAEQEHMAAISANAQRIAAERRGVLEPGQMALLLQEVGQLAPSTFDAGTDSAAQFRDALAETNITLDEFAMRMAAGQATGADFANFMSTTFATAVGAGAGAAMDVMIGKSVQLIRLDKEGKRIADESALSRGEAFQAAARDAVKAVAIEAVVRAAFHGAAALGSLAILDFRGAALHGKAAASYAIAAGLAGAAAASIPAVTKTTRERGGGGGADTTLDRFGRPGFGGGGGQGGDTMVLNVTVGPGASPEDVADATVRQLQTWARNRNRRLRIEE